MIWLIIGSRAEIEITEAAAAISRMSHDTTETKMKLWTLTANYYADETGAVTVDWVVLTAAVCSLLAVAMAGLQGNMSSIGQKAQDHLSSQAIVTTF
jgi:hypothetical protein